MKNLIIKITIAFVLAIIALGFLCGVIARGANIVFQFQTGYGQRAVPTVSITPPNPPVYQTNTLILGGMTTFPWPTNGLAVDAFGNTNFFGWTNAANGTPQLWLPMAAGTYTVNVSGWPRPWTLPVPLTANTLFAADLATNNLVILAPQPITLVGTISTNISNATGTNVNLAGTFSGTLASVNAVGNYDPSSHQGNPAISVSGSGPFPAITATGGIIADYFTGDGSGLQNIQYLSASFNIADVPVAVAPASGLLDFTAFNTGIAAQTFFGSLASSNLTGTLPVARLPGITTNLQFRMSGYATNTLYFTNGILMRISQP